MALLIRHLWNRPLACIPPLVAAAAVFLTAPAPAQMRDEYQVKAAFIFNFAHFVDWPADAFHDSKDPITTCVLGRDPFGHWLTDTIEGHSVEGRPLIFRLLSKPSEAASCHILFVGASEPRRTWSALAETRRSGLLTIGENDDAGEAGAVITFMLENDRVHFGINTQAAELEKLRISSRLLTLAKSIRK